MKDVEISIHYFFKYFFMFLKEVSSGLHLFD